MRFGSLFAGIGGFDEGFSRAGMRCVWQAEIDSQAQRVLEHHYPNTKRFPDIRECGKHNLNSVDVICGGFPCQDLSSAGKREGIEGERSGLFYEMTRVVNELRPTYLVWENVPGLLSGRNGKDMLAVIRELDRIGYCGTWTGLDARFFGLAQRRRRIFGVFTQRHFGTRRCAEILSLANRCKGNPQTSGKEKTNVAASLRSRTARNGGNPGGRGGEDDYNLVVNAIDAHMGMGGVDDNSAQSHQMVADTLGCRSDTLERSGAFIPIAIQDGFSSAKKQQGGVGFSTDTMYTLDTKGSHAVGFQANGIGSKRAGDLTLSASDVNGTNQVVNTDVAVRRLTPIECCRLQGFPDDWLDLEPSLSDFAKYRLLGNAVAVPVAKWIGEQIMRVERGHHR